MKIKQPSKFTSGRVSVQFNANFSKRRTEQFEKAQQIIDQDVLRFCQPLIPFDKGILALSGRLNTDIGSGEVTYATPYAARMYYNPQYDFQGGPHRGAFWFERMKARSLDRIRENASEVLR